ncbi:WD40-repeat-containing domain protein, partial [Powellomyces hirtus]
SSSSSATSCQFFAVVAQGVDAFRLRIWDTRTSTLTMEHVAPAGITCTAVVWGTIGDNAAVDDSKKKRRRSGAPAGSTSQKVVAVGLSNGEVQLFSVAHGKVIRTLQGAHSAGVTHFAFAIDGVRGFSSGHDGLTVEWDVRSGAELGRYTDGKPVKKVCVSHDGTRLLTAGHAIKMWDLSTRELLRTYHGHASEVTKLQFSADDVNFVSAADDDRHIYVWDAARDGNSSDHVMALTTDSSLSHVALSGTDHVLALTDEGLVRLWANATKKDSAAPAKPKKKRATAVKSAEGLLRIISSEEGDESKQLPVLAATFSDSKILLARGNVVKPVFERVDYLTEDGKLEASIELSRKPVHSVLMSQDAAQVPSSSKSLVTPYSENDILVLGAADLPIDSSTMMGDASLLSNSEQNALKEPTLEERLSAITVSSAPSDAKTRKSKRPPTANSLHQMLSQAIHTSDVQLLEQALQVHDGDMILATVRRLPPSQVIPLLDQLMLRLQKRPNRAKELIEWVRAVVLVHAGYLMSVPHITSSLGALYQTLDSRASVFQKLLRLSGRLDLVVSQNALKNRTANGEVQEEEALYTYDEDEDDDSEDEDAVDGMEVDEEEEEEEDEDDDEDEEDEEEDDENEE